jgi:hypothetical protein
VLRMSAGSDGSRPASVRGRASSSAKAASIARR